MRLPKRLRGDPGRTRVVVLLACVLALESADLATIGAAAPQLEAAFHISNAQLGLLAAISTFVGAVATLPMGALSDRVRRVNLLMVSVSLWAVAMGACALAQTYGWLLLARLGLGAVTATAGPAIVSNSGKVSVVVRRFVAESCYWGSREMDEWSNCRTRFRA